jgi:hypothetical protein
MVNKHDTQVKNALPDDNANLNVTVNSGFIYTAYKSCYDCSADPSSRTMALGSTQPLTEMSTRNLPGG